MTTTETWIDKTTWGPGPWQDEPDRVEWYDGDLACLALRHPGAGHWCGYVAVPPGHPWHGKSEYCPAPDCDWESCPHRIDVHVHGGITFARGCAPKTEGVEPRTQVCHVPRPGEPDDVWWLGFDFHHSNDLAPAMAARERDLGFGEGWRTAYRDIGYVRAQCASVAEQARVAS